MPDLELENEYQSLRALKAKHRDSLFSLPNVVGVGIGRKLVGGEYTAELSIRVYVIEKKSLDELGPDECVPPHLEGIPTDVIEAGPVLPAAVYADRERPARGGCSISGGLQVGTLGVLCRDTTDNTMVILSNSHVIADADDVVRNSASVGDSVLQPGIGDGEIPPLPDAEIATLKRWKKFEFDPHRNKIDAAIAQVVNENVVSPEIHDVGVPQGYRALTPADVGVTTVHKVGRTTGHTVGVIFDIAYDTVISYGHGFVYFDDQIIIQGIDDPFVSGGDSGSAVLDSEKKLVGLIWGSLGSDRGLACHIVDVFDELAIDLGPPGLPDQWTGWAGENNCKCLIFDGQHLYAGLGTDPIQVVKIDPQEMATVSVWTGESIETNLRALMFDTLFLYMALGTEPARVIKKIMRDLDEEGV